jgi:hypothetical protein
MRGNTVLHKRTLVTPYQWLHNNKEVWPNFGHNLGIFCLQSDVEFKKNMLNLDQVHFHSTPFGKCHCCVWSIARVTWLTKQQLFVPHIMNLSCGFASREAWMKLGICKSCNFYVFFFVCKWKVARYKQCSSFRSFDWRHHEMQSQREPVYHFIPIYCRST